MTDYDPDKLLGYVEGELDASTQAEVEAELEAQPELRRLVDQLAADRAALRGLGDEPAPAGLADEAVGRLERAALLDGPAGRIEPEPRGRRVWRWLGVAAAAAVVLLAAGVILQTLLGPAVIGPDAVWRNNGGSPEVATRENGDAEPGQARDSAAQSADDGEAVNEAGDRTGGDADALAAGPADELDKPTGDQAESSGDKAGKPRALASAKSAGSEGSEKSSSEAKSADAAPDAPADGKPDDPKLALKQQRAQGQEQATESLGSASAAPSAEGNKAPEGSDTAKASDTPEPAEAADAASEQQPARANRPAEVERQPGDRALAEPRLARQGGRGNRSEPAQATAEQPVASDEADRADQPAERAAASPPASQFEQRQGIAARYRVTAKPAELSETLRRWAEQHAAVVSWPHEAPHRLADDRAAAPAATHPTGEGKDEARGEPAGSLLSEVRQRFADAEPAATQPARGSSGRATAGRWFVALPAIHQQAFDTALRRAARSVEPAAQSAATTQPAGAASPAELGEKLTAPDPAAHPTELAQPFTEQPRWLVVQLDVQPTNPDSP